MRTIYKYPLELGNCIVNIPVGSRILSVGSQRGTVCLWAEVDKISPYTGKEPALIERKFCVIGTGHPLPNNLIYIDTVVMEPFVWHVYEILKPVGIPVQIIEDLTN